MKIKSLLAKPFASFIYKSIKKGQKTAIEDQDKILKNLINIGRNTEIGKTSGLDKVNSYEEFRQAIKIVDYEAMKHWIEKIKEAIQKYKSKSPVQQ